MKKRRRHTPEQIVKKLRDADAMLTAGSELGSVRHAVRVCWCPASSSHGPHCFTRVSKRMGSTRMGTQIGTERSWFLNAFITAVTNRTKRP